MPDPSISSPDQQPRDDAFDDDVSPVGASPAAASAHLDALNGSDTAITVIAGDVLSSDVLSSDMSGTTVVDGARPARFHRSRTVLVAAGAVVALVIGLGAVAGYRKFFAAGRPPEQFTPGSVAAFVGLNLNVSLEQQIAAVRLANKVNNVDGLGGISSTTGDSAGGDGADRPADAMGWLLDRLRLPGVNVKRDFAGWLGERASLSIWMNDRSQGFLLVSALSRDDDKAARGLARAAEQSNGNLGYVLRDGTALIAVNGVGLGVEGSAADVAKAAQEAAAEARQSPLDAVPAFREAREWVGDDQLATIWLDVNRYQRVMTAGLGAGPTALATESQATAVMGVRASSDGLAARYRTFHAGAKPGRARDAVRQMSSLPANTSAAVVVAFPHLHPMGPQTVPDPYVALIGFFSGLWYAPPDLTDEETVSVGGGPERELTPEQVKEIEALLGKDPAELTAAESKRLQELIGYSPNKLPRPGEPMPGTASNGLDEFPDPTGAFSAATATFAMTGGWDVPTSRLRVEAADDAGAAVIAQQMRGGRDAKVTVDGTVVTVQTGGFETGSGALADRALFAEAMADAPTGSELAVFVDFSSGLSAQKRQRFPLQALGIAHAVDNGEYVGMVRLLVA